MSYVKCNACITPQACDETIPHNSDTPGMCWNAYANLRRYELSRGAASAPAVAAASEPSGSAPPRPPAAPPRPAQAPAKGSVTDTIFAACDAALAELRAADPGKWGSADALAEARKVAIPRLEAQGVNSNSARKGSSMWVQARR